MPKIRDVKTFITCPDGINLVVVKVETDEPGLYGLGCATFTQRCQAVKTLIDEHLKPLVVGREASEIQELWNLMYQNAYWRNGPVINNAVAGIDIPGGTHALPVRQRRKQRGDSRQGAETVGGRLSPYPSAVHAHERVSPDAEGVETGRGEGRVLPGSSCLYAGDGGTFRARAGEDGL